MADNPRRNSEGYYDPTAYHAIRNVMQEDSNLENEVSTLVKVLKYIISKSGFELISRIELKDKKTGRMFR